MIKLAKIEDGILEPDDYFFTSKTIDFLGDAMFSMDDKQHTFEIYDGWLERNFYHDSFVIVATKKSVVLEEGETHAIYTRKVGRRHGVIERYSEKGEPTATNFKIIQYQGYVQTYLSFDDKKNWIECGGGQIREYTDVQGFNVEGNTPLTITKYETYKSPYLTFINLDDGNLVKIVDNKSQILFADEVELGQVEFFLHDNIYAKVQIFNGRNLIYESDFINFNQGDIYANIPYDIEIYYGRLLQQYESTKLNNLKDKVQIKNASKTDTYTNVILTARHENLDDITLSLDGINYDKSVIIDTLKPQEIRDLYIWIKKSSELQGLGTRSFVLEIDG